MRKLEEAVASCAEEHRELLSECRALEAMLEGSDEPRTGELARRLSRFAAVLEHHIGDERRSDLYARLPERMPELQDRIRQLALQHRALVERLRKLSEESDRTARAPLYSNLSLQVRKAVADFRRHEVNEVTLLQATQEMPAATANVA